MNRTITTYALALVVALSTACSKDEKPNSQPEISSISAAPEVVAPGAKAVVAVSASDPDGDGLAYAWTVPAGWTIEGATDAASIVVAAPVAFNQTAIVGVTVSDGRGKYRREQVTVRTSSAADRSVSITSLAAVPNPVTPGGTAVLQALAVSTASGAITYGWSVDDTAWTITGSGASATLVAPTAWADTATVTVTADDGSGAPATAKVVVATAPVSPPEVAALTATPGTVVPGGTVGLAAVASSSHGLALSYAWSVAGTGWTVTGSGADATATAPLARASMAAVTVTVTDAAGASASRTAWVSTSDVAITTIAGPTATPNPVAPGGTIALSAAATTFATSPLSWTWSVDDTAWTITGSGTSATLVAPTAWADSATVTVTADDGTGSPATAKLIVSTAPTSPPTITALTAAPTTVGPGGTVGLSAVASGAMGLGVTYSWSVAGTGWTVTGSGANATATAPLARSSLAAVTVTVTDAAGASASRTAWVATSDAPMTVITDVIALPNPAGPGGTIALDAWFETLSTSSIAWTWSVDDTAWTIGGTGDSATLVAPTEWGASATVSVVADDGSGAPATAKVIVSTPPAIPPDVSELTATPATVNPGGTVALSSIASAAYGLDLTYAWSVAGTGWSVTGSGASATATAPLAKSVPAVVTLTVTDGAGASASRTVSVSTNTAPTTTVSASIAGTPPLMGVVGAALSLDASGSSSTGGGTLAYSWKVSSAPVGPGASLTPTGTGATASFTGAVAGSYGIEVTVTDAEGASATASTSIQVEAASSVTSSSGDAQTATVGTTLSLPLAAAIQTGSGAAAPGVPVTWRIAGGTLLTSDAVSDADGVVHATVKVGRIAGPGSVTVALASDPTKQVTFTFTAAVGAPAAIAVSAGQGVVGTGAVVHVRVVDAYGNEAPGGAADDDQFSLTASSGALFGADVEGGVGTLVSGGGTGAIVGQLVGGQLDIRLDHTKVEDITLSLKVAPGLTTPLPYSGWQTLLFDSANRGFASGWTTSATGAPWGVVTGSKAATAPRAFGIELTAAQAVAAGQGRMAYALGALAVPLVRLDFVHEATVTSATDPAAGCRVQPSLSVAMRSGGGAESPDRPAPLAGWPVYDACDGRPGFSTTTGFEAAAFDLTDAVNTGYGNLSFELSNDPTPLTAADPVAWYVDDILVQSLKQPAWAGATITVRLAPGAPASVAFLSNAPGLIYRACVTGRQPWDVTARIFDAYGNLTESELAFGLSWTGNPVPSPVKGELLEAGSSAVKIQFEAGEAVLRLTAPSNQAITVTLSDPDAVGLALAAPIGGTLSSYYCHSTGTGYNWSDYVPTGSINPTQAVRACETHYGAGTCATWTAFAFPNVAPYNSASCATLYRWAYSGWGGPCNSYSAASVTPGYWQYYSCWGSCTCYGCAGSGNYGWYQTGTSVGWN